MAHKGKNTTTAVALRRNEVLEFILDGATKEQIRRWFTTNHPSLSEHTIDKDITFAYQERQKYVIKHPEEVVDENVAGYERIARKAEDAMQYDSAVRARQAKEKVLGMHNKPDVQVNIQQNTMNLDHLSKEDLDELILKLK
jgi:hypothetical protein